MTSIQQSDPGEWIFTFGFDHINPITGERLNNHYVRIPGSHEQARAEMQSRFGNRWSMQYPTGWHGIDKYELTELVLEGGGESVVDHDDERDYWQEYKDDVAMGRIDRDGNQLDPPEPDWGEREGSEGR